ncbi:MAG TPA: glycosyl hydrolase family 28-related protein, partial [Candidatus Angelobacter sp.]|nr:glycosyl hydrolase family 28-related protein [Candidatus Angelobacter sp.]
MTSRREFFKLLAVGGSGIFLRQARWTSFSPIASAALDGTQEPANAWSMVPQILARIKPPVFPNRDFDVTKFGAVGDGKVDCTQAFQKTIAACAAAGGGRVVVPAGEFSTGAIHLKSKVNLHLASGAVVRFTRDTRKYPLVFTRWEGVELMNYSPLIYAFEQQDIAITGD